MNDKTKTCEGCIDRRPGCHAGCAGYLQRRKAFDEAAEIRNKARASRIQIDEYEIEGQRKRNRNIIKRRTK